jgi:hypothetical protein
MRAARQGTHNTLRRGEVSGAVASRSSRREPVVPARDRSELPDDRRWNRPRTPPSRLWPAHAQEDDRG